MLHVRVWNWYTYLPDSDTFWHLGRGSCSCSSTSGSFCKKRALHLWWTAIGMLLVHFLPAALTMKSCWYVYTAQLDSHSPWCTTSVAFLLLMSPHDQYKYHTFPFWPPNEEISNFMQQCLVQDSTHECACRSLHNCFYGPTHIHTMCLQNPAQAKAGQDLAGVVQDRACFWAIHLHKSIWYAL